MPASDKAEFIVAECEKAFRVEIESAAQLAVKAEKYLAAAGAVLSVQVIGSWPASAPTPAHFWPIAIMSVLGSVIIIAAMLSALISMRVRKYATYPDGDLLVDSLKSGELTLKAAQLAVAKMYLTARTDNLRINNRRAQLLAVCGGLLVAGFILIVTSQVASRILEIGL